MKFRAILLLAGLTACAPQANLQPQAQPAPQANLPPLAQPAPQIVQVATDPCPKVYDYGQDPQFVRKAQAEVALLPADSAIVEMIKDYYSLREAAIGCHLLVRGDR
jgi:hypothetical protein